ncbi:MAG TPA: hypothetical protein VIT45_14760 [Allosphingosinicella sp.]
MGEPMTILILAFATVLGLASTSLAALKGWRGWLNLKQLELARAQYPDHSPPSAAGRIELADLKERVRKLEAIANGDL